MSPSGHDIFKPFFDHLEEKLKLVRPVAGNPVITRRTTSYVLDGEEMTIASDASEHSDISITFWVGLNEHRLHFISYLNQDADDCRKRFAFCFGGAEKAGWDIFYEPLQRDIISGCSVWGTCETNAALVEETQRWWRTRRELTVEGRYWATDVAMMVQSMLRTAERYRISCMDINPEPL